MRRSLLVVAGVALCLTGAQSGPVLTGYVYHHSEALVSLFDPVQDQFIGAAPNPQLGSGVPENFFPYPDVVNATHLVAVGRGSDRILRMSTTIQSVQASDPLLSLIRGSFYVRGSTLKPHVAVVEPYITQSSSVIEFIDLELMAPVELKASGSMNSSWRDVAYSYNDGGTSDPQDDIHTYWIADDGANGGPPRVSRIRLTHDQTLISDPDPFNPNPKSSGPPFPLVSTLLDQEPATTWMETFMTIGLQPSAQVEMEHWKWNGTNYIVVAYSQGSGSLWSVGLNVINADADAPAGSTAFGGDDAPCFRQMKVAGEYAVVTEGDEPGGGGNSIYFVHLPSVVAGQPPVRDVVEQVGADGVGIHPSASKVYVGTDANDDAVRVLQVDLTDPVTPVTFDQGTFTLMTDEESQQFPAPWRPYPYRFAFTSNSQTHAWPDDGSGGGGGGDICSAGASDPRGALLLLLGGMLVLSWCGRRCLARRRRTRPPA